MKSMIVLLLILLPFLAFSQGTKEDYDIYSKFLKEFTASKKIDKIHFVINETVVYSRQYYISNIDEVVTDLKSYLGGNKNSAANLTFRFRDFAKTLVADTTWVSLVEIVDQKMKRSFKIENNFSPVLQTTIIDTDQYNKYFKKFKTSKQIERNWQRFHKNYNISSMYNRSSILIEFSDIASDGKEAAFYFSWRCGGLCGEGDLVFFSKENGEWKFLHLTPLWYN